MKNTFSLSFVVFAVILLSWCTLSPDANSSPIVVIDTQDTATMTTWDMMTWDVIMPDDTTTPPTSNDTKNYTLSFNGTTPDPITVDLKAWDRFLIHVQQPNDGTIFRVSQIKYPDDHFDGPFEADMDFDVLTGGIYKFIISANLMAGTSEASYTGDVLVMTKISDKQ